MTDYLAVCGIDPGPTPGMVMLWFVDQQFKSARVLQCNADAAPDLLDDWIRSTPGYARAMVQAEKFVNGHRSARSSTAGAGQVTRDLLGELKRVTSGQCALVTQTASRVKAWATDERLEAAGLLEPTKGMRHARDGARHALFCAVNSGGIPDPLSKRWGA